MVNLLVSRTAVPDANIDPHAVHLIDLDEWSLYGHGPFHTRGWTAWEQYLTHGFGVLVSPTAAGRFHHGLYGWESANLFSHRRNHRSFDVKRWRITNILERNDYVKINLRSCLYRIIGIDKESSLLNVHFPIAYPGALLRPKLLLKIVIGSPSLNQLTVVDSQGTESKNCQNNSGNNSDALQYRSYPLSIVGFAFLALFGFVIFGYFYWQAHYNFKFSISFFLFFAFLGSLVGAYGFYKFVQAVLDHDDQLEQGARTFWHDGNTVTQKLLTAPYFCNTLIVIGRAHMANVLSIDKQVQIISALAEGSGIRQIERMTGVHRDTIMRLGVRIGKGCAALMDGKMRDLPCENLQLDELWGFIGKKQKHVLPDDNPTCGDFWTFCAIDSDTKLVPSFKVGKRDMATANAFVSDVASRMRNRIQISTDGLPGYVEAVERAFGMNVDYAQIIKVFESEAADAEVIRMDKKIFSGHPDLSLASTRSYLINTFKPLLDCKLCETE
jgi:hypothetical protein